MSYPTNEPAVDFSTLCAPKIDENIRSPAFSLPLSCLLQPDVSFYDFTAPTTIPFTI